MVQEEFLSAVLNSVYLGIVFLHTKIWEFAEGRDPLDRLTDEVKKIPRKQILYKKFKTSSYSALSNLSPKCEKVT